MYCCVQSSVLRAEDAKLMRHPEVAWPTIEVLEFDHSFYVEGHEERIA